MLRKRTCSLQRPSPLTDSHNAPHACIWSCCFNSSPLRSASEWSVALLGSLSEETLQVIVQSDNRLNISEEL